MESTTLTPAENSLPAPIPLPTTSLPGVVSLPITSEKIDISSIENHPALTAPTEPEPEPEPLSEEEPESPKLTTEQRKTKNRIIRKIRGYFDRFSFLGKYDPDEYETCDDLDELSDSLDDIRSRLASRSGEKMIKSTYLSAVNLAEISSRGTQIHLDGLTAMLDPGNNRDVEDTLAEICLEYSDYLYVDPLYRLIMSTVMAAYAVHRLNSSKTPKAEVPPAVQEKFSDI